MAKTQFFRINENTVPDKHHPPRCPGLLLPALTGGVDGVGRPIAAPGLPYTVLKWYDTISVETYLYWRNMIGRFNTCLILHDLAIPDPNSNDAVEGYAHHSIFTSGILWRIELSAGEDAYQATLNRNEAFIRGGATIRVTEIGGGPII